MKIFILFVIYMVLFFCMYKIIFWFKKRKKSNELNRLFEIYFIERQFKIDVKKLSLEKLLNLIALGNAFIFTTTLLLTMMISNIVVRILVMFVILLPMIYVVYYCISRYSLKKGMKKNV